MEQAIIDTSAIYAVAVRAEMRHVIADAFVQHWLAKRNEFVLLDWIFSEAMTLIKGRFGTEPALRVGRRLRDNLLYRWVAVTPDDEREVWVVFQRYADKQWSYTDCALLVLSRRLKIPQVFTYDAHFAQMPGIKRVGG